MSAALPTCANCGQRIRPKRKRIEYEINVLRATFPEARTRGEIVAACISRVYEQVMAERLVPLRKVV